MERERESEGEMAIFDSPDQRHHSRSSQSRAKKVARGLLSKWPAGDSERGGERRGRLRLTFSTTQSTEQHLHPPTQTCSHKNICKVPYTQK